MLPPLTIMPPRFTLEVPVEQAEVVERLCNFETAEHVHRAMLAACNWIEKEVKPQHYNKPHVQAAAFVLFKELAYYRGQAQASRVKRPRCNDEILNLVQPYRKGYYGAY